MGQRWLRWLVRFFPAGFRETRAEELQDAITDNTPTGLAVIGESFALARAAATAWRRFLNTPTGIHHAMFTGALAWFGVLLAFGPIGRLRAYDTLPIDVTGRFAFDEVVAQPQAIVAATLLAGCFVTLLFNRFAALAIGLVGLCFSALSIRVGAWQFAPAVVYEVSWIGLALVVALLLRARRKVSWPIGVLACLPGAAILLGPFVPPFATPVVGIHGSNESETWVTWDPTDALAFQPYQVEHALSTGWIQIVLVTAALILALSPWIFPAVSVATLPAIAHLTLHGRSAQMIGLLVYLVAAMWLRSHVMVHAQNWRNHRLT